MKTLSSILLAIVALLASAQRGSAALMEFYLNHASATEWELYVSTEVPYGIAAFSVLLDNATSGTSVAPEGWAPGVGGTGFTNGNTFLLNATGHEAYAFQINTGPSPHKCVLGLGYQSVPDTTFGPFMTKGAGNAAVDGLPGYPGFQLKVYTGTMNAANPVAFSPQQNYNSGYLVGQPRDFGSGNMGYDVIWPIDYGYHVVPEPSAALLAGALVALPAIRFARRRLAWLSP